MVNFRHISQVKRAFGSVITRLSSDKAVKEQAQQNGGAMNTSAQSSVQTATEKAMKSRRDALLGHTVGLLVTAPEAPHLESHNDDQQHSPANLRYRLRRRGGRGQGQDQGKGGQGQPR